MFGGLFQKGSGGGLYKVNPSERVCSNSSAERAAAASLSAVTGTASPSVLNVIRVERSARGLWGGGGGGPPPPPPPDGKQGGALSVVADLFTVNGGFPLRV